MTARLGFVAAAAIVVANMIGTGIFTSTGYQAIGMQDAGTILVAWLVGGVLALCGASAYAELGSMMPKAGGEYVYLREAYHPLVGFLSGWTSLLAGFSAPIGVAALAFGTYGAQVFPGLAGNERYLGVGLILAMTALHGFDTVLGGRVQAVFSIGKAALIVVFIVAGLAFGDGDWSHFDARAGGLDNVLTEDFAVGLMFVMFAYSGWNAAAYIASDIKEPTRNVPRALLAGTALVTVLYLLLTVTFLYALDIPTLAAPIHDVGDEAAKALFDDTAGRLLSTLIALGLVSAVSAMVMAGPRVYAAMADDDALPRVLAHRSRRGVPVVAVLLQGAIASAVVLYGELGKVMLYVGFLLSIFAALTVASVFVFRIRQPDAPRPYRDVGYPIAPLLFVGVSAWVTYAQIDRGLGHVWWGLGSIGSGVVVWTLSRWVQGRSSRSV
jgi:APA family basic amino acid/polyamine antiporter